MRNEKLKRVLGILLCLVLLVQYVPVTARAADAPETVTIYFQNNWLWTDVCIYYWDSNGNNSWPGSSMQMVENDGTYDIYKYEVPVNVTGIIINGIKDDGSGNRDQTPDITGGWYDGICYYMHWDNGNHVGSFAEYCEHAGMTRTDNEDGATHKAVCPVTECGYTVEAEDHAYEDGTCACGAVCGHNSHDTDGKCTVCGAEVGHSFDAQGKCACGAECPHTTKTEGVCDTCGKADAHICTYDNGFCEKVAGETHYEPAVLNGDGWYEISNAGQLYWFAEKVNSYAHGENFSTANVVLTADITVNAPGTQEPRMWYGLGIASEHYSNGPMMPEDDPYRGTFDGNGHTVSGLYGAENRFFAGLVTNLGVGGCVKNVTVSGSVMNNTLAGHGVAAVVGWNRGTVSNCYNTSDMSVGTNVGGIVGLNMGVVEFCGNTGSIIATGVHSAVAGGIAARNAGIIRNCWNTGMVSSENGNAGGLAGQQIVKAYVFEMEGYYNCDNVRMEYCWSNGDVSADANRAGGIVGSLAGVSSVVGCYTDMATVYGQTDTANGEPVITDASTKTAEQFASGEVAYLLQKDQTEQAWGQDLDNGKTVQTVPTFDGAPVYRGYTACTDTAAKYTNDAAISPDPIPHDWEYTADGAQITAECKYGCGTQGGKVTLTTPEDTVYNGAEKTVTAEGTLAGIDTLPAVTYQGDRVNVGTFTAKLTVGDATAQLPVQILPYELEVKTFVPQEKIYDGTTTCGIKTLTFVSTANGEELVLGTDFTAELTFPDKNAGEYDDAVLTVTLLDTAKANNYVLTESTVTGVIHSITPATITVTDVKVADKVYDGTTDVTVTGVVISGNLPSDDVKVTVEAAFADKNSGENKTVNLTYTLTGADAGNYALAETTGTTTASITAKALEDIMNPVKDLTVENVTSDDKDALEDVKQELEDVLTDEGLSDDDRKEREDALKDVQDMLDRIQDAADAITTDPILDTKDITDENVVLEDKDNIIAALEDLYGALEDYENNYTDAEKEGIHDDIQRLEAALAALKQVEDLIKAIEELPEEVQPDTPYRKDILDAKDAYDALDDHQKGLIPEEVVQKLNDLLADLKVYLIIKGDGQTWSEGELSFTANGPLDLFMELQIDGNTVAASNYTAVSGSTIVTLKESYAQTLTAGKHSIKFVYPDGEAVGSFTVVIPTNGSAETGDEAQILFWSAAMVLSLAALAVMMAGSKKRRYAK